MTKIRIISAAVAIASVIAIVRSSGYVGIAITVFFICFAGLREYGRMVMDLPELHRARSFLSFLGLGVFSLSVLRNEAGLDTLVLSALLIFMFFLLLAKNEAVTLETLVHKAGLGILGVLYVGVCPVYICLLAKISEGLEWFIYTLCVVFSGDIAAYFVGRKFGQTKLFERISPNKSLEGAIGSLFASVVVGLVLRALLFADKDTFWILALTVLTSIVAQLGDLAESLLKRAFHTKDSGHLMPGHGGVLDRLDGLLFAAPFVYMFARYVIP
jgi:phosphatidate cytidylyltransferase